MTTAQTAASEVLARHSRATLQQSGFFAALANGEASLDTVRKVFGQYYLWRNQFHRWFGVVVTRSPAFGTQFKIDYVLSELVEHIQQEIAEDHHGLCKTFLWHLGLSDLSDLTPHAITAAYSASFIERYTNGNRTFHEALAALAGREIVASPRNRVIIQAMERKYGVREGLHFFNLHEDLEREHFEGLWTALLETHPADPDQLLQVALREIDLHVRFWDDLYHEFNRASTVHGRVLQ